MTTYILLTEANKYQSIVPMNDEDWKVFRGFDGKPQGKDWKSPLVEVLVDKEHKNRPSSDTPDFTTHIPVFSKKAVEILEGLIEPFGEFLKLAIDEHELYAFNVTKVVDALDLAKSEYETFRDGKRIMRIRRHMFKSSVVESLPIFKIVQLPLMYVYVNDLFVQKVKANGLTGFMFHPAHEQR